MLVSYAESREQYDEVAAKLAMRTDVPPGLIVHAAAEVDGRVQIVDVWESPEARQRFEQERLLPAFAATGVLERMQQQGPPVPAETFDLVTG